MIMKWQEGRLGTGYKKFKFFSSEKFKCDGYLIKYLVGSCIPKHFDPSPAGLVHKRMNLIFGYDLVGGDFGIVENPQYPSTIRRFEFVLFDHHIEILYVLFYPSESEHFVDRVESGLRYVLSFGWLTKK